MEAVIVAVIGAIGLLGNTWLTMKTKRAAENVDRKTETNHGMEPWEYLEMILEVRQGVLDVKEAQIGQQQALIEHTSQDHINFEQLADLIKRSTS